MMTADDESLHAECYESDAGNDPGLTSSDFDALDRVYSSRVKALSSKASLIRQGCAALDADEILQILKTDPDVFSDAKNGHCVGSNDIEADQESLPVGTSYDPLEGFKKATQSFLHRFASDNDLFVADNAAWVKGFDPVAFGRHVQRTSKARRYHGIEDIVFDQAGRVRSVRGLNKRL